MVEGCAIIPCFASGIDFNLSFRVSHLHTGHTFTNEATGTKATTLNAKRYEEEP